MPLELRCTGAEMLRGQVLRGSRVEGLEMISLATHEVGGSRISGQN